MMVEVDWVVGVTGWVVSEGMKEEVREGVMEGVMEGVEKGTSRSSVDSLPCTCEHSALTATNHAMHRHKHALKLHDMHPQTLGHGVSDANWQHVRHCWQCPRAIITSNPQGGYRNGPYRKKSPMLPGRLQSFWTLSQICPQSDARSVHSPFPAEGAVAALPASQATSFVQLYPRQ